MFPTFLSFTERHPRYVALMGFSLFIMGWVLFCFQQINLQKTLLSPSSNFSAPKVKEIQKPFTEPERLDFGTSIPPEFPTDVPIEKDVVLEQSYGLNYESQKQLSLVFDSAKTVKENYTLYSDFLKERKWTVLNVYEGEGVSSLYATKENNDINVTIIEDILDTTTTSHVSISILKK